MSFFPNQNGKDVFKDPLKPHRRKSFNYKGQSFMCFIACSWKSLVVFNVPMLVLMTRLLTNMSTTFYPVALIPFVFPGSCQSHWGQDITEFRLRSLLDSFVSESGKHLHRRCKTVRLSRSVRKLNTFFRPLGWNCYLNKGCCWLTSYNEIHKDAFFASLFWVF